LLTTELLTALITLASAINPVGAAILDSTRRIRLPIYPPQPRVASPSAVFSKLFSKTPKEKHKCTRLTQQTAETKVSGIENF
jgi:hypothetical protein